MKAGSHYTPESRSKLNDSLGTKLYFNLPVKILSSDNMSVISSLTYFEFKEKLDKGEKFYTSTQTSPAHTDPLTNEEIPAQTVEDITWTAAKLEKYVTEDLLNGIIQPITAYKELFNNKHVTVHEWVDGWNENGDPKKTDQTMSIFISSVLADLDTGMASFYSDADMKTLLTREQLSALEENANIYRKYKTFKVYMINAFDGKPFDTPQNKTISSIVMEILNDPNSHIYADVACTTEYTTAAEIKALSDSTSLYQKFVEPETNN